MLRYLKSNVILPFAERHQKRDISSKLIEIKYDYLLTKTQREKKRQEQIHRVLQVAKKKVPYYKELFKKLHFDPEIILRDLRHLQELPFLTKEIVEEQGDRLLNTGFHKSALHLRKTGGSTGPCTKIYYDQLALDWTSAANQFALSFTGRQPSELECYISPTYKNNLNWKDWAKHWVLNRHNTHTTSFDNKSLEYLWQELKRKKPFVVHGHPSIMYALSKFLESAKDFDLCIQAFESTGETLDEKKRIAIEKNLKCKVYNRYGNAEFGVVAHSKDDPHMLEILDFICHPETLSLGNGLDEIILTTTTNIAMPLIRYRTGDIGQLVKYEDRDYFHKIQGRVHDLIEINGKVFSTHLIQDEFDKIGHIDEFQIVQKKNGRKQLKLVVSREANKMDIMNQIQQIFKSSEIEICFTQFEDLILSGWRDKFKYVVYE